MPILIAHFDKMGTSKQCEFKTWDAMTVFVRACGERMVPEVIELEIVGYKRGKTEDVLCYIRESSRIQGPGAFEMEMDALDFMELFI